MLLFADPNKQGGFEAILNAYRLHKHGSRWSADYGNGGYVLYEAIGRECNRAFLSSALSGTAFARWL